MPVQSWGHRHYWRARPNPVVVAAPTLGGYPRWQAAVVATSGLAALQLAWVWLTQQWAWLGALWVEYTTLRATWAALSLDQRRAMRAAFLAIQSPAWPIAQTLVHETAHTLGFADPQAWAAVGAALRDRRGLAENLWRHLRVVDRLAQTAPAVDATLTNPGRHLLIELAYHEYGASGRGRPPVIP